MSIQILQDIQLNGGIQFLEPLADFPTNPSIGTMVLKGTAIYAYITIGGMETWYPFANRTNSYVHTQGLANTVWTITHNLHTTDVWVQIKGTDGKIINAPITVVDQDTVRVNFTVAVVGTAVIVAPDSIDVPEVKTSLISVGSNVVIDTTGVKINGSYALTSANIQSDIDATVAAEATLRTNADAAIQTQITNNINQSVKTTATPTFAGLNTSSHILPTTDIAYDLGSMTKRFRDLYLSGSTIYVGDGKLSFNATTNKFDFYDGNNTTVAVSLAANNTDDLVEGTTNLYWTPARAATKVSTSAIGAANGVAPLGSDSKIAATYLPSYVDDVLEYTNQASFPTSGETGKIYVALNTNKTYRWSGSVYVEISSGPANTDSLSEGATNLYFTDARAQAAVTTITGNAGTATKLQTARTIAATGDITGTATSFDGSANISIATTLPNIVTASTAAKITYNAKGQVTAGAALLTSDIPSLDASKITTGSFNVAQGGTGVTTITGLIKGNGASAFSAAIAGTDYASPSDVVLYNGITSAAGKFDGGTTTPTGTNRLNYSGYFYPTQLNLVATADVVTAATHYMVETATDGVVRPKTLANVQSEIVTTATLGTGTADSNTFLAGDRTWKTVTGGATLSDDTATNATYYPTFTTATSGAMTTAKVSSTKLTFNPSTGQLNATVFNATSDRNAKENIQPITNALDIVKQVQGVSFDWKDTGAKSYGYIAQDIEKIIPDVVSTDLAGRKSVNYDATIAILLEAVKELTTKVEALEAINSK